MDSIRNNNILVSARDLYKRFGPTEALRGLSLEVKSGEILGLLGPNGAGKTTAIHIFLGLLTPTSGETKVLGLSPLKQRHQISKSINFSSAYTYLPTNLKVIENLKLFARIYGVKKPKEKIGELLELFEMTQLTSRLTGALSSGEKTRLNLCKCLLNDPCLLFLDEPTASLDPEMADTVRKILKKIHQERKIGILYTSHNMAEVEEMCHRILFIVKGKISVEGDSETLLKKFGSRNLDEVFVKIVRNSEKNC